MNKERFKNPYFWFGIVGVILSAMGINPEMLTSWDAVIQAIKALISNPYMIGAVVFAITGVFVNPNTKGMTDKEE